MSQLKLAEALAAIDDALSIGDDGCGGADETLTAIEDLKEDAERYRFLSSCNLSEQKDVMASLEIGGAMLDEAIDRAIDEALARSNNARK